MKYSTENLQNILMHAAYGRAMIAAHRLELKLAIFLLCHAIENNTQKSIESIKKMTFGALINEFVKKYDVPSELEEELDNMLFFRNELAHRILETIMRAALENDWRDKVIHEMIEIESMFSETDELLDPYMRRCYLIAKVTDADLHRMAEQLYPGLRVCG